MLSKGRYFVRYLLFKPTRNSKDILVSLLENLPQHDPFQSDIVLVQSPGMAQWLQMEIAKKTRRCSEFPIPHAFQFYLETLRR